MTFLLLSMVNHMELTEKYITRYALVFIALLTVNFFTIKDARAVCLFGPCNYEECSYEKVKECERDDKFCAKAAYALCDKEFPKYKYWEKGNHVILQYLEDEKDMICGGCSGLKICTATDTNCRIYRDNEYGRMNFSQILRKHTGLSSKRELINQVNQSLTIYFELEAREEK